MKILSIGNFGTSWDGSICDEEHIAQALEGFDHEVIRWQREEVGDSYPRFFKPDFILVAQWDNYPGNFPISNDGKKWNNVSFLEMLKHTFKCPVVYWAFDYQDDQQDWHLQLVENADLYLSKRLADSRFPNWQWLSQDFAPLFLSPGQSPNLTKPIDVLFTGTYLPWATERNTILKAVDEKYNLVIHSVNPDQWKEQGFKNVNGPVMDEALPELIAHAKINLSIDHTIEAGYWSDRNAQIMACGGFVLFRYVDLSTAIFRNNIIYFHDTESCLKLIEYWLEHDGEREYIATHGASFARQNLTVMSRATDLLNIVGSIL